ncbi:MAG: sigma-70 family RNA polymerase sigma factor, partial [Planctomycetales bacterium]|nr:sigma-70 family RNA polymerase sigma factor [Planctomycetales bacterium]NIM09258.1 sigma-70 family RNA polymerase sigma factor [Planctomycetales bacterium]NIN08726.1 sigma-70 family RNA polymerase sigma factor [Planctomycetales bacterium]NIN77844.1 sigma-70 family RNA polymerase sigma factor [Planctomycetales bacterium]NIO35028.1 sigma-70 family RNA polymerase sigma factor [Planctomycetales bacterium]
MICLHKNPARRQTHHRTGRGRPDPRTAERARRLQTQEIAFIDNREFRDSDAELQILDGQLPSDDAPAPSLPPGMPAHLQRLCSAPLLSANQETLLFRQMNYLKYRANVLRSHLQDGDADPAQLDHIEDLVRRSVEVRNGIVRANIRLVMSIAKNFADTRNRFDDLLSEGVNSLLRAVDKFDYSRGFRFSTYATSVIRRDLIRLLRNNYNRRQRFATGTAASLERESVPAEETDLRVAEDDWDLVSHNLQQMLKTLDRREEVIVRARYGL